MFLPQARRAQCASLAALRMAVDMVAEGVISPEEGLLRLEGIDLGALGETHFAPPLPKPLAHAVVAAPGVAVGPIALDGAAASRFAAAGTPAILIRREALTADAAAVVDAAGLLTAIGSRTAPATVVARQLGKPCLVGCAGMAIDLPRRLCRFGGTVLAEGDPISLDGDTGAVYAGALPVVTERPKRELAVVAAWMAAFRQSAPGRAAAGEAASLLHEATEYAA